MQVLTIPEADALHLASKDEDHFYDRKAAAISGAKLQKVAVAFANADGGDIYIGIADDSDQPDPTKRWQGARLIEDYNQLIQALTEIQPSVPMEISFLRSVFSDFYVLRIQIEKSESVHRTSDGSVYERKGAQSLPIKDPARITALSFAKGASSYEDYSVESAIAEDVVDSLAISEFLSEYSLRTDPPRPDLK